MSFFTTSWENLHQVEAMVPFSSVLGTAIIIVLIVLLLGVAHRHHQKLMKIMRFKSLLDDAKVAACPYDDLSNILEKVNGTVFAPNLEDERYFPYYRRTRNYMNIYRNQPELLASGEWYGYGEWLQDIIAGHMDLNAYIRPAVIQTKTEGEIQNEKNA